MRANRYRPGAERKDAFQAKEARQVRQDKLTPLGPENDIDSHFVRNWDWLSWVPLLWLKRIKDNVLQDFYDAATGKLRLAGLYLTAPLSINPAVPTLAAPTRRKAFLYLIFHWAIGAGWML